MTNLFEDFREYQSRKVDSPLYSPLNKEILSKDEAKKLRQREYAKQYYANHIEDRRAYYREYRKKRHANKKNSYSNTGGIKGLQLKIYNYMVEQYKQSKRMPRATEISKALSMDAQAVYNSVFSLIKKWYIGRWAIGKYYLINPPIENEIVIEKETAESPEMVYVEEQHFDSLVDENAKLRNENLELKNKIKELVARPTVATNLDKEVEELKLVIRLLLKYFG